MFLTSSKIDTGLMGVMLHGNLNYLKKIALLALSILLYVLLEFHGKILLGTLIGVVALGQFEYMWNWNAVFFVFFPSLIIVWRKWL